MKNSEDIEKDIYHKELATDIFDKTVDGLYKGLPSSAAATIVIAAFLSFVLWGLIENKIIIIWFPLVVLINGARIILYRKYCQRDKNINETYYWDRIYYFLLVLNALILSSVSIFLLPGTDSVYHYFPEMILIGMAAGAVSSLSYSLRNIITYFIVLLAPLFIVEIMIGSAISFSVAGLVILLALFSLTNAKRFNQTVIENITLQFQSEQYNKELVKSRNSAIEANKAKTSFISMISHELRTPLNAIMGFSQLLKMSDTPALNDEQKDQTQGITDSGQHLLSLIDELLDLSRIESRKIKLAKEYISLNDVIDESISLMRTIAAVYDIKIKNNINDIYLINADRKRLKQVFINLISNAIKYNRDNGLVTIDIKEVSASKIRVSVTDTGHGLTQKQIHGLFKAFERYNDKKEGIGLGLYITKNLVELMGGEISVECETDKGCTFSIELNFNEKISP